MSCPKNCIEERTTLCLVYDGPDISEYGIKKGDPINDVIAKLLTGTTPSVPETTETQTVSTRTYKVGTTSKCARDITNTQFSYDLSSTSGGSILSWNIPNNLPNGYNLYTTKVTTSGNGLINSTHSKVGSVTIPPERFPVTLDIEQRVGTPCGDIKLYKTVSIPQNVGNFKNNLSVLDLNNSEVEQTLDESIDTIYSQLSQQKQQIEDFKVVDCESKINILNQELINLSNQDPLQSVEYTDNGVTESKDLTSIINDLYSLIRTVEADVFAVNNTVNSLQIQLNSLQIQ